MRKVVFLVAVFVVLLSSCKKKVKQVLPMEKEKAVALLADVRLATELTKYFDDEDRDSILLTYMDSIYSIHKVDSLKYKELEGWLESNINIYYQIEQLVHKKLKDIAEKSEGRKN